VCLPDAIRSLHCARLGAGFFRLRPFAVPADDERRGPPIQYVLVGELEFHETERHPMDIRKMGHQAEIGAILDEEFHWCPTPMRAHKQHVLPHHLAMEDE